MELAARERKVSDSWQALKRSMEAVVGEIENKRQKLGDVFLGPVMDWLGEACLQSLGK